MTIYPSPYPSTPVPEISLFSFLFPEHDDRYHDPAFIDPISGVSCSRAQTQARARMIAFGLRNGMERKGLMNISRNRTILIFSPNCLLLPLTLLGAIAGGIKVSLASSGYTSGELAYQIKDSGPTHLLVHPSLLPIALAALETLKVHPEDIARRILLLASTEEVTPEVRSKGFLCLDDIIWDKKQLWIEKFDGDQAHMTAVTFYSSGTTGLPKGVELTHHNLVAVIIGVRNPDRYIEIPGRDLVMGVVPFYHIYGFLVLILNPLATKIPSVILPKFVPEIFLSTIQKYRVTILYIAPPIAVFFANSPLLEKYDLSSLKKISSAAAPLSVSVQQLAVQRLRKAGVKEPRISQVFGITELSPAVTETPYHRDDKPSSVGKLLSNLEARFVDDDGNDVPPGEPGEFWVRGPTVMKGYANKPHATRAAITPDGWFKTGDIARRDEEGFIYIVDRKKELIKYKGYGIAPAEIENVLSSHPSVRDCAVIGISVSESGDELPRAYIVPRDQSVLDIPPKLLVTELQQWVKERLAPYKQLRGGVVFVQEIPRSLAGKILRRHLRERALKESKEPERPKL